MIHPQAIISPGAIISADAEIGPGAIIGPEVTIGPGCTIQAHAVIDGHTTIGEKNFIGYGAVIGAPPQDFAWNPSIPSEVRIGNRNTFREYVTIHRGTKQDTVTSVGDDNFLMVGAHLGHNVRLGNNIIIANNALLAGYVHVDDRAVLGGGTVFHQHMRIGRLCMIRGGTGYNKDLPPYTSANANNSVSGLNAIGLRRSGLTPEKRAELKRAFKLVYWSGLNVSQALEQAKQESWSPETQLFFDFIATSKRGIAALNRGVAAGEEETMDQ